MTNIKPTAVFFGSGPVAAMSLKLLSQHCSIEAVVTKPATKSDMASIVKDTPVYSVATKADLDNLIATHHFESSLGILIDFGIIVSSEVINYFKKGIINSHFSLLPEWRGADPITFSILSGQQETGISLMLIDKGMDTGNILSQAKYEIPDSADSSSLTQALIELSDQELKRIIPLWLTNEVSAKSQEEATIAESITPTYSRKINKVDGIMVFTKSATLLEREIRAFIEWPKSRTTIAGKDVVILAAAVKKRTNNANPGKMYITDDKNIGIHCQVDDLIIKELKPAGKRAMTSQSFIAGYGNKL